MRLRRYIGWVALTLLFVACTPIPLARPERPALTAPRPSSAEELVARAVEAVHRPGKVFYARLRIEDSDMPGVRTVQIWFDGERQAARHEEWRNGQPAGVTVWEGWASAHYAPQVNRVYTSTVPIGFRLEGVNPALAAFAPGLLSLALQREWEVSASVPLAGPGEWDPDRPWHVEAVVPMPEGEWKDHRLRIIADVEGGTFLPIREQVRLESPAGQVRFTSTITYLEKGFLDRDRLLPDFLTQAAVQAMVITLEQRLAQARQLDFTVWWLGQTHAHPFQDAHGQHRPGLSLTDVRFQKREGEIVGVALEYGVPETSTTYVRMWQYPATEWVRLQADHVPWWQTDEAEAETVTVHGVEATLYRLAGMMPPGPDLAPTPTVALSPDMATKVAAKEAQRGAWVPTPTAPPLHAPVLPASTPEGAATPQVVEVPPLRPPPIYALILPLEGTVIRLETSPMISGGRQVNPLHNREAIIKLAQALRPL